MRLGMTYLTLPTLFLADRKNTARHRWRSYDACTSAMAGEFIPNLADNTAYHRAYAHVLIPPSSMPRFRASYKHLPRR